MTLPQNRESQRIATLFVLKKYCWIGLIALALTLTVSRIFWLYSHFKRHFDITALNTTEIPAESAALMFDDVVSSWGILRNSNPATDAGIVAVPPNSIRVRWMHAGKVYDRTVRVFGEITPLNRTKEPPQLTISIDPECGRASAIWEASIESAVAKKMAKAVQQSCMNFSDHDTPKDAPPWPPGAL
jgi:hypothetical protein